MSCLLALRLITLIVWIVIAHTLLYIYRFEWKNRFRQSRETFKYLLNITYDKNKNLSITNNATEDTTSMTSLKYIFKLNKNCQIMSDVHRENQNRKSKKNEINLLRLSTHKTTKFSEQHFKSKWLARKRCFLNDEKIKCFDK